MENLLNIINLLSKKQNDGDKQPSENKIPKEVLDQYPYGDFPIRYTKAGQENIRKHSENRFSYNEQEEYKEHHSHNEDNSLNLSTLLPLIQLMSGKQQPKDMMKIFSKLLFKDNKDLQKIFDNLPIKSKEIDNKDSFPDLNRVNISSLKRVD